MGEGIAGPSLQERGTKALVKARRPGAAALYRGDGAYRSFAHRSRRSLCTDDCADWPCKRSASPARLAAALWKALRAPPCPLTHLLG